MTIKDTLGVTQITKVGYANQSKKVLRVNVPITVAQLLDLHYGDTVIWLVLEDENGKRMAAFKKITPEDVKKF